MNKSLIFIPGLLVLGMLIGITMMNNRDSGEPAEDRTQADTAHVVNSKPPSNPFTPAPAQMDNGRIEQLQKRIEQLGQRVDVLEHHIADNAGATHEIGVKSELTATPELPMPGSGLNMTLSADNLIKAGIIPETANEIVRRKNEIDLKKLELRDRASREHYLGTSRYNRELNELNADDVSLRDELGDEYYDSYLFATGHNNRVMVSSVMIGSQAELAGILAGDIILNYDGQRLFEWSELQQATTEGARGEYVNVTVMRGEQQISLLVPRGPLGVRLGAARREP